MIPVLQRNGNPAAEACVGEAIRDLIQKFPLAGLSIAGRSISVQSSKHTPMWSTNGVVINFNPEYVVGSGFGTRTFDLLHEWFHVFGNHIARRGERDVSRWNWSTDCAVIYQVCTILDLPAPTDGIFVPTWTHGLSAEQIYDNIPVNFITALQRYKAECCSAEPGTAAEQQDFHEAFQQDLSSAAVFTAQLQRQLPETIQSRLDAVLRGTLPWARLLRGTVQAQLGSGRSTWVPPRRKLLPHVVLPSTRALKTKKLALLVDVSASMDKATMDAVISNIGPAAARATSTVVVTFDEVVREVVEVKNPRDVLSRVKFLSGNHSRTDSRGAFEVARRAAARSTACFTDGLIVLPEVQWPTTFVVPQGMKPLPWGRTITMEVHW